MASRRPDPQRRGRAAQPFSATGERGESDAARAGATATNRALSAPQPGLDGGARRSLAPGSARAVDPPDQDAAAVPVEDSDDLLDIARLEPSGYDERVHGS